MKKDLMIGTHLKFARAGVEVNGVTPSALVKPANDADYNVELGCVEDFDIKKEVSYIEKRCPVPGGGRYRTRKKIPVGQKMKFAFSMQQWSEFTLVELLYNAKTPNAGNFKPNDRNVDVEGWLDIKKYDQNDDLILDLQVYISPDVESYKFDEKVDPYAFVAELLHSDLNDGDLTNL